MEFNEKLQALRKQKGLTQEELAEALYVSRTAISKWESGRGYPSIDSLKAIATFFSVTVDELLSSGEILTIAETDHKHQAGHFRDLVFGLLDVSVAMLFFLPFFGQTVNGVLSEVSLLNLTNARTYLTVAYWIILIGLVAWGILALSLQNVGAILWKHLKHTVSLLVNVAGVLLFIVSAQPYAAALLFVFLIIKAMVLLKKP